MEPKKKEYKLFTFTPEIMQQIAETKEIPVHFYNKEGQIVIYKKKNASEVEIDRLFRYTQQGTLYYDVDDSETLGIKDKQTRDIPEGFTDTKLLTEKNAQDLTQETRAIFSTLKKTAITSIHARRTSEKLTQVFKDFESNPDSLTGLVNIIELLAGKKKRIRSRISYQTRCCSNGNENTGYFFSEL
jgi:hypothetical protein